MMAKKHAHSNSLAGASLLVLFEIQRRLLVLHKSCRKPSLQNISSSGQRGEIVTTKQLLPQQFVAQTSFEGEHQTMENHAAANQDDADRELTKARTVHPRTSTMVRGPHGDFANSVIDIDDQGGLIHKVIDALIAETTVKDIPTTEYRIFIYNEKDARKKRELPKGRRPAWTGAFQNPFITKGSREWNSWNHFHVVVWDDVEALQYDEGNVTLTLGAGGAKDQWANGRIYADLLPFPDQVETLYAPRGITTCIKLKFELADYPIEFAEDDELGKPLEVGCINPYSSPQPQRWFDTFRMEISQWGFKHYLSFNARFVDEQGEDPKNPGFTQPRLFSITGIKKEGRDIERGPQGGTIYTYTYCVKMAHREGLDLDGEEQQ
ncbi:hypothetical protein FDECE_1691 [Fusarium decemcellulare]|nr:hypothetical protein FDECE_1691 [Fusarium decemcellulare]